jgi:hypothetical protein
MKIRIPKWLRASRDPQGKKKRNQLTREKNKEIHRPVDIVTNKAAG